MIVRFLVYVDVGLSNIYNIYIVCFWIVGESLLVLSFLNISLDLVSLYYNTYK